MTTICKPPIPLSGDYPSSVFLAGSIEMGDAPDWQTEITHLLKGHVKTIFNPRRDDWDSSWIQSIENDQFRHQVEWELEALERATVIALYFAPSTKAPISLLELGLYAKSGKLLVCCPDGFWRKGNVDIVCAAYRVRQCGTIVELVDAVSKLIGEA